MLLALLFSRLQLTIWSLETGCQDHFASFRLTLCMFSLDMRKSLGYHLHLLIVSWRLLPLLPTPFNCNSPAPVL